jgi:hypothetical protein
MSVAHVRSIGDPCINLLRILNVQYYVGQIQLAHLYFRLSKSYICCVDAYSPARGGIIMGQGHERTTSYISSW